MSLAPEVQAHLDHEEAMPPGLGVDGVRAHLRRQVDRAFDAFGLAGPDVDVVEDHDVTVRDGARLRARLYRADRGRPAAAAHLVLHGGGWTTGSIDEKVADAAARHIAAGVDVAVVALDYRLAPEFPFPTAVHDVVDTAHWLRREPGRLGLCGGEVSLGGTSAGGNLAAAAVLADPQLRPRGLVLEVPALDLTGTSALAELPRLGCEADLALERSQLAAYLGGMDAGGTSPTASPLLAPDLSGFPETWLLTAELDPLRAEAAAFAERLAEVGVRCHTTRYPGALHGSPILTRSWPVARQWLSDRVDAVRTIHHRQGRTA